MHIETAIVLGQVTLEMLGWLLSVEQTPIISDGGFGAFPAADKLKLLLSSSSIPMAAPSELPLLRRLAKAENRQGPDVLVALRNSIVHRSKKKRELAVKKKLGGDVPHQERPLVRGLPESRQGRQAARFSAAFTGCSGRAGRYVVVAALDRFGVKDAYEMGRFFTILRDHDCRLLDANGKHLNAEDDATVLTSTIGALTSTRERKEKAGRVLTSKVRRRGEGGC